MTGEVHLIKHTSETMSTRRMKIDEGRKSETRQKSAEHNGNGKRIWKD